MTENKCGKCFVCKIVGLLVIVGALNWGAIAILHKDPIARVLMNVPHATGILYALVGLAGLVKLISCFKDCPACKK